MRQVRNTFSGSWLFLVLPLFIFTGCDTETDDQLLAKITPCLNEGSFRNQGEAVDAVSQLLSRDNPKVKEPQIVDCLITTGAELLTDNAQWTNRIEARNIYDLIKRYDNGVIIEVLVSKVIKDEKNRLHVLFLSVKLGIPTSEERLNEVLDQHGDQKMAEDFLNSGSSKLYNGGKSWANNHGYQILRGMGSHRVSWGEF